MVFSRYNHLCHLQSSEDYLLYNFLTGALLRVNPDTASRLKDINLLTDDEKALLFENGFLVDNFDEIKYLKYGNKITCTDREMLSILIAPTMACNFRCPYCFEHHGQGMMQEDVQGAIISFIEEHLTRNQNRQLFVYWFGGEPLLGINIIERMSARILEIADRLGVRYTSAMSTNGYYLTEKNLAVLERCRLSRIQITLDGMREMHDRTRVLANGEGSFDVIVGNLRRAKTTIPIHIRSNLTRENVVEFAALKRLIREIREANHLDISLYGAHMSVYNFNNENVDDLELSIEEYSNALKENNMFGGSKKSACKFAFCTAAKVHSFCFDEKGNIYKCWNDIGNPAFAYDNVFSANRNGISFLNNNALDFLAESFPDECVDCLVLPLCMGGCIKKRVVEDRKSCSPVKFNLEGYINSRFFEQIGGVRNDSDNPGD